MELNQCKQTHFPVGNKSMLTIKNSCVSQQAADGVIIPTNTECIVSGAADAVIRTIEAARASETCKDVFSTLFGFTIKNPPDRNQSQIYFDLELRDPVGALGETIISKPLPKLCHNLQQNWQRIVLALIRSQARPPDFTDNFSKKSVESSITKALQMMVSHNLKTVATVPFGTGMSSVSLNQTAEFMIPAIVDVLESDQTSISRIVITETYLAKYLEFSSATAKVLSELGKLY